MFENLRKLKELKNKSKTHRKYLSEKDESGYYVYEIGVSKEEFYSPLATDKNKIINSEIVERLDDVANCLASKDNLAIRIKKEGTSPLEVKDVHEALAESYSRRIVKSEWETHRYMKESLICFLVGILLFVGYVMLKTYINSNWFEIIDIVSWVFLWESVDLFFITSNVKKMEQLSYQKIINAKIIIQELQPVIENAK